MTVEIKIGQVEYCNAVGKCQASPQGYVSYMGNSWRKPSSAQVAQHALQQLDAARQKDVAAHERNVPIIESNRKIHEHVVAMMDEIGMPKGWSEPDRKSRSRFPKQIRHDAGYLVDLRREAKLDDGFASASMTYESLKKRYDEYATQAEREAEIERTKAAREQETAKAERCANIEMVAVILRYGLDLDATWADILHALRDRDRYLDLAIAMENVRGDWSEGPDEVRDALDGFTIENDRDKEIASDVIDGLTDFCDGRVFRDSRWGYDALYGIVEDQQLATDARLARGKVREG